MDTPPPVRPISDSMPSSHAGSSNAAPSNRSAAARGSTGARGKTARPPESTRAAERPSTRESSREQTRTSGAQGKGKAGRIKHFVLDTNVLLHDPAALFVFQEHEVVIPVTVIEEIDTFKRDAGDRGRNAREVIRHLDRLRQMGKLVEGVKWGDACDIDGLIPKARLEDPTKTGSVRIEIGEFPRPHSIREDKPDNRIIAVAHGLAQKHTGEEVVFVSKDLNARIKADVLGLTSEDFENTKVNADALYSGYVTLEVDGDLIDELYKDRMLSLSKLAPVLEGRLDSENARRGLFANQYVILRDIDDENHTGLARRLGDTDHVIPVTAPRKPTFGILPRNLQQTMALDLLLDDEIRMVTLMGGAGTGKTLMAVAAGMAKVFNEERYDKMLVARPIMPMGRDIGYLPGSKDDKLSAWMQPIFDNVGYLLSTRGAPMQQADSKSTEQRITSLMDSGKLVLEPLTYIRGRSIPHQFMIVDEAQNLTPHEVKTIISRIGEGTKVILTGDVQQIDNP